MYGFVSYGDEMYRGVTYGDISYRYEVETQGAENIEHWPSKSLAGPVLYVFYVLHDLYLDWLEGI